MIPVPTAKVDMHCHSTASQVAKLGIQRSLGLPECATPPDEVYELAKRRGMDFVTITDHDTIDGCLELVDRPDAFISEELTARFRGEPQAVHVLCYGIASEDHEFLQEHADDVEECAAYMRAHGIACGLAHPFYDVAAPLAPRHRRRLARLFPIWETRNGARAPALNQPAAIYVETRGGTGIGGSDDHAGVDIGRTWTEVPPATTPEEFLRHVQEGHADACGGQGSAEKWAHSALALAVRALAPRQAGERSPEPVNPASVLDMAERVVAHGIERGGSPGGELGPDDALALLRAWLGSLELDDDPWALIELMLQDGFSHADLARRARLLHERRLREAVEGVAAEPAGLDRSAGLAPGLFAACIPAVPYVPAATFLGREKAKLADGEGEPGRVALVVDGAGAMHGVTQTVEQVRERGVPGWDVEVVGTDARVDRRLAAVAELEIPSYPGLAVGVPSVPELVGNLTEGRYDLIHIVSPGPAGIGAALTARIGGLPLCGSYHTELAAYAALRTGDPRIEAAARLVLSLFYRQCDVVLSPSPTADASLASLGVDAERLGRWVRGVDLNLFDPRRRSPDGLPGVVRVLYAGRLSIEKGVDLLADAFLRRGSATRACTFCWREAARRRGCCASVWASGSRSSAGWAARSWRACTRAPTCSCSAAAPTPTAR